MSRLRRFFLFSAALLILSTVISGEDAIKPVDSGPIETATEEAAANNPVDGGSSLASTEAEQINSAEASKETEVKSEMKDADQEQLNKDKASTEEQPKDAHHASSTEETEKPLLSDDKDQYLYAGKPFDPEAYGRSLYDNNYRDPTADDLESGFHMDEFDPSHVYTFPVEGGREECFSVDIYDTTRARVRGSYFVSSGGTMEILFKATVDHDGKTETIVSHGAKSEETFFFIAEQKGQYNFCFQNPSSHSGEKVITFAIHILRDPTERKGKGDYAKGQHVVSLSASVRDIRQTVQELEAEQLFLKERMKRHMAMQDGTEWRVAWYTVFESLFMFMITFGQVWYVQRLINQRVWV